MPDKATTKQAKASKYTEKHIARMHAVYDPAASDDVRRAQVKQLAEEFGQEFSRASIVSKLQFLKRADGTMLYVPYKQPEKGLRAQSKSKAEIVRDIEAALNLDKDSIHTLVKGNKDHLQAVADAVTARTTNAEEVEEAED